MAEALQPAPSLTPVAAVQKLSGGRFLSDLEAAIVRVAEEVVRTGKPGGVTVKFKITKPQDGEPLVTVQEGISIALPVPAGSGAFYFVHEGGLHASDPRQVEMDLRIVQQPETAERKVTPETTVRTTA